MTRTTVYALGLLTGACGTHAARSPGGAIKRLDDSMQDYLSEVQAAGSHSFPNTGWTRGVGNDVGEPGDRAEQRLGVGGCSDHAESIFAHLLPLTIADTFTPLK